MAWVQKAGLRSELGLGVGPEEQREQRDTSQPPPPTRTRLERGIPQSWWDWFHKVAKGRKVPC